MSGQFSIFSQKLEENFENTKLPKVQGIFIKILCDICRSITTTLNVLKEMQPRVSDLQDLCGKGNLLKWKTVYLSH